MAEPEVFNLSYRIAEPEPNVFYTQIYTAAGWTTMNQLASLPEAVADIDLDKTKRAWTIKYYDEDGNLLA